MVFAVFCALQQASADGIILGKNFVGYFDSNGIYIL